MKNKITSRIYDNNVLKQGLEYQVEKYYQPKDISSIRRIKVVLKALSPKVNERILDIGCGVGTFAYYCAKVGASSIGMDYSVESLRAANNLSKRFGVDGNAKFIVADATRLSFKELFFDKVCAIDFIEHITDEEKELLLEEIYRVLKQNGVAVIFTPNMIRERIGEAYWNIRSKITKERVPKTDLHYGLTTKSNFEALLNKFKFSFQFKYVDITRPYLAKIPILKKFLALELLWVLKK